MAILSVKLKPSLQLTVILGFAHLSITCLLWVMTLSIFIKLLGTIFLLISMWLYSRYFALLLSAKSIVSFELSEAMLCTIKTRSGEHFDCKILGSSFVSPYLLILNLKPLDRFFVRNLIILNDAINTEKFRKLRVLLRWKWKSLN